MLKSKMKAYTYIFKINALMVANKLFNTILVLLISHLSYSQSPWVKGKNKGYFQLGVSNISYNQVVYNSNVLPALGDTRDFTAQLYGEYGLSKKLDATIVLPFKNIGYKNTGGTINESISGIGNTTFGLKYLLQDAKWKISTGIQFSANTITKNNAKGLRTGFDATTILPYVTIGSSSKKWYYYTNLGYGYMSNNYSDYIKIGAEVGYNFAPRAHVMLVSELKNNVAKENFYTTDNIAYRGTATYLDRQNYIAIGLKLNYEFIPNKFGVNFAVIGAVSNENAPAAPSINFGIYTKF
jgi:hypothetical protein